MTEYLDRYPTMNEYAEGKRINPKLTDLISRADAIEAVQKVVLDADAINALKALPSADAVHGEWVRKEKEINDCDGHRAYYWFECSVCGARPPKNQWKNEWHSNYCPSCGARMKGGAE